MSREFGELHKLGHMNMDAGRLMNDWTRGWQAIAAEMGDYTRRSMQDGTSTYEKILHAKSIDQVVALQTGYMKRAYDDYMQQLSKIGGMYMSLTKEAMKPGDRLPGR